jgi:pseudaminic acid cytidylyltransferase
MSAVAIIPARGGSKRIPEKNIRVFAGKPIISYSIEAAKTSALFDRIIVSTDSDNIARIAVSHGAETPFRRPTDLSDDFTPTAPVILHALEWLAQNGAMPTYFCCLYATAPFLTAHYLKQGLRILKEFNCTVCFAVTSFPFPIERALKIDKSGEIRMVWPEHENARSNDLPERYHDAGQFYWGDTVKFLKEKRLYASHCRPVVLPRHLVVDIDTPEDWRLAEMMYHAYKTLRKDRSS